MTKQQIAAQIKETEQKLANLREQLEKPEKITDFKLGDVYFRGVVPIIVAEIWGSNQGLYHVIGNDYGCGNYLRAYSDCRKGLNHEQMLDYLNKKIENGWQYVGNISADFDAAVRKVCRL